VYRFRKIDVSGVGSFDSDQSLYFSDGLTVVEATNRFGNITTIVETLRQNYEGANQTNSIAENTEIYSWLVFYDDKIRRGPNGGYAWEPLASLISSSQTFFDRHNEFDDYVTKYIRQILDEKIQGKSKFLGLIESSEQLSASVKREGVIVIKSNKDGYDISHCFQSIGESLVLYVSVNLAVRKLFLLDIPFVVASRFETQEQSVRSAIFQCINDVCGQIIVLAPDNDLQKLGLNAEFRIITHPVTGKSIIEKCA